MYAYENVNTEFSCLFPSFCSSEMITMYSFDCIFLDCCLCTYKDSTHMYKVYPTYTHIHFCLYKNEICFFFCNQFYFPLSIMHVFLSQYIQTSLRVFHDCAQYFILCLTCFLLSFGLFLTFCGYEQRCSKHLCNISICTSINTYTKFLSQRFCTLNILKFYFQISFQG